MANSNDGWLVMVYMAGDNNLTEAMVSALQSLMAAGKPEGDAIVAQLDPSGLGLPTQTYDFTRPQQGDGRYLHDHLVPDRDINETNTGNPGALRDFIDWATARYPDQHRLLILSGHGSGTTEDFLLQDDSPADSLTIDELSTALAGIRIDILGMDACFMSMFEVAARIRESVGILIGAEGLEPQFGWPYERILKEAREFRDAKGRPMRPAELATSIVKSYVEFYSDYDRSAGRSADLAAIDLSKLPGLEEALFRNGGLADRLNTAVKNQQQDTITLAHWYAQTYKADQFVDLHDLCLQLHRLFDEKDEGIQKACKSVIQALDGGLDALDGKRPNGHGCILLSGCTGFAYQHSHGLSIYFPWARVSPDYAKSMERVSGAEKWVQLLRQQVDHTKREQRVPRQAFAARSGQPVSDPGLEKLAGKLADTVAKRRVGFLLRMFDGLGFEGLEDIREALGILGNEKIKDRVAGRLAEKLRTQILANAAELVADMPPEDACRALISRYTGPASKYTGPASKYTGPASKYTGPASKYTGPASKYTGPASKYNAGMTRFADDRDRAVKNLPVWIGKDYWPRAWTWRDGGQELAVEAASPAATSR